MGAFTGPSSQTERGGFDAPYMHPTMLQCYSYSAQDTQIQLLSKSKIRMLQYPCIRILMFELMTVPMPSTTMTNYLTQYAPP